MICPVEIAQEMSALRAVRMREHAKHGLLPEGRDGAGDERTGRNVAGDGQEDYLVARSGDTGHKRPKYAAVAGTLRRRGLQRVVGPAVGKAVASSGASGDCGEGVRTVPGEVFRSERAALSREIAGRARDRAELHLGETGEGAGLVGHGQKRGAHRKRRVRRPLPGMRLHIDGSRHQWFQDER